MSDGTELWFDGADIQVRANLSFGSESVFVTFSSRSERAGGFRGDGFGEAFLASRGIDHVCFVNKRNHWWQSIEVAEAFAEIAEKGRLAGYRCVIVYGASMGGYGALLAADRLGTDLCLAFSPQVRIDGSLPLVPTWRNDLAGVPIILAPFDGTAPPRGELVLLLDPMSRIDIAHARALQAIVTAAIVAVPFAAHGTALYLHEIDLLKPFLLDAAVGRFDPRDARARIRATRRSSSRYWYGLGTRLGARGRARESAAAFDRALDVALADGRCASDFLHVQVKRAVMAALRRDDGAAADDLARRYLAARTDEALPAMIASLIARTLRRPVEAVEHARRAVALEPKTGWPRQLLARALIAARQVEEAEEVARKAAGLKRGDRREWLGLSRAFELVGANPAALASARSALRMRANDPDLQTFVARLEKRLAGV